MSVINKGIFGIAIVGLTFGLVTDVSAKNLRMSSQWTETTAGAKVDKWWASEIDKRTNGAVKIKIFGLAYLVKLRKI